MTFFATLRPFLVPVSFLA